jgi:hypothetical protein
MIRPWLRVFLKPAEGLRQGQRRTTKIRQLSSPGSFEEALKYCNCNKLSKNRDGVTGPCGFAKQTYFPYEDRFFYFIQPFRTMAGRSLDIAVHKREKANININSVANFRPKSLNLSPLAKKIIPEITFACLAALARKISSGSKALLKMKMACRRKKINFMRTLLCYFNICYNLIRGVGEEAGWGDSFQYQLIQSNALQFKNGAAFSSLFTLPYKRAASFFVARFYFGKINYGT